MPNKIEGRLETNEYTTPAPTLLDPQGIMTVEQAREAVAIYNGLLTDYHRALLHRETVINSMAAAIGPVVLAHVKRDAQGVHEALQDYVQKHVSVYGPGATSGATH